MFLLQLLALFILPKPLYGDKFRLDFVVHGIKELTEFIINGNAGKVIIFKEGMIIKNYLNIDYIVKDSKNTITII